MQFEEILARRRSVRSYQSKPVPRSIITRLLRAANSAPSGANASPWLYVVVEARLTKHAIRQASEEADRRWNATQSRAFKTWLASQRISYQKPFLEDAPVLIVAFSDERSPYAVESTWLSLAFLILAATEAGLGTLTYTPGDPAFLTTLLGVPTYYRPQAILPLGYPRDDEVSHARPKPAVRTSARLNHYQTPYG